MNYIYEKNGFVYVKCDDPSYEFPDWITTDFSAGDPYFLLNTYTRKKFSEYFLPLLKSGVFKIHKDLYYDIKTFVQNPTIPCDKPLITHYKDITLKKYQETAVNLMLTHKRYALFYGTGTGKTIISIFYLLITRPKRVVIITPKKVISQYEAECSKYLNTWYTIGGTNVEDNKIVIVNSESIHKLNYKWIDCLIIDESHKAKNYMSDINKQLRDMSTRCSNIYLFTGTPIDRLRHDIFPQLAILDYRIMPSKTRFLFRYFKIDLYKNPVSERRNLTEEITTMIKDYSHGVTTKSVVELPPINYIKVDAIHPFDYYDKLYKERFLQVELDGETYTAIGDTPTTLRVKLQEICSGFLLNTEKETKKKTPEYCDILLPTATIKQNVLKKLLRDKTFEQGIIFTCFDLEIQLIAEVLDNEKYTRYPRDIKYAIIDGKTKVEDCNKIREDLRLEKIDIVIANTKCTNAGLDLFFLNKVIFYSLPDSYITYHQCCSRIYRIGQLKECYIYHIICRDTVEQQKFKALSMKKSFSTKLFNTYKEDKL